MTVEAVSGHDAVKWQEAIAGAPKADEVIKEIAAARRREQQIVGFGRFLVCFGTAVGILGAVAGGALLIAGSTIALFSNPIGWAIAICVTGVAVVMALGGAGIISKVSKEKLANLLIPFKRGVICALSVLTIGLAWAWADQESLKIGYEEGAGGSSNKFRQLSQGILFGDWRGEEPTEALKLKFKREAGAQFGKYKIKKGKVVSFTFDIEKAVVPQEKNKNSLTVDERKNVYNERIIPLVKESKYGEACDLLWCLYNNETVIKKKQTFALEIAALMVRAKERPRMTEYFRKNKEDTEEMIKFEIAQMSQETHEPRLIAAYHLLTT